MRERSPRTPPRLSGDGLSTAIARALAVAEVNASMGRIVAAPTGGASGVLPAVLTTIAERTGASREQTVLALVTAAAIGGIIAARATLSGAAGGCQAEIGSAAAMAAAAAVELAGGTPAQAGHAASFAMQGLLGLACDPVGGRVEIPCVARNATGCAVALTGVEMALSGATSRYHSTRSSTRWHTSAAACRPRCARRPAADSPAPPPARRLASAASRT